MIIPPGRKCLVEIVGRLLAMEKWYWTKIYPLEERAPGTNPSRSLDYVVTVLGCYYMLGQCDWVQKQLVLTHLISY